MMGRLVSMALILSCAVNLAHASVGGEESAAKGKQLFAATCSRCHGPNMVNPGTVSYDLRKFPATEKDRFRNAILNGKGAMPGWQGTFSDEDIEALWMYVLTGGK